jgi:phytoene/squalene synthetase
MSLVFFINFSHLRPMSELETYCAKQVRTYDYDRFLTSLFAPSTVREDLFALFAFNHEVAKIREAVSEPMLGEIRLQWWREAIEGIYAGEPRNHEVVLPLSDAIHKHKLSKELFLDIIDARAADIYDENPQTLDDFEIYLGATSGNLMRLAADITAPEDQNLSDLAYDMGVVWGLIGTIRSIRYHISLNKLSLPQDLMDEHGVRKRDIFSQEQGDNISSLIKALCDAAKRHLNHIATEKKIITKQTKTIFLLSALSRSYLNMIKKADYNPFKINEKASMFPRQCRLFFSALLGLV